MNRRSHWITHLFDGLIANVSARVTYILLDQLSSSQHVKPDILPVLRLERQLWISRKGRAPSSLSTSSRCRLLWCCQNCSIPSCQHTNTNGDVGHPLRAYMLSKTICMRPLGDSAPNCSISAHVPALHTIKACASINAPFINTKTSRPMRI